MKKIAGMVFALFLVFILAACTGAHDNISDSEALKVTDTVSGYTVALGETKKEMEAKFGKGTKNPWGGYDYEAAGIAVEYSAGSVLYIQTATNARGEQRHALYRFEPGMSQQETQAYYEPGVYNNEKIAFYQMYYDASGNPCSEEQKIYSVAITYIDGEYSSFYISGKNEK